MPWIGALIAARSAPARIDGLGERMLGSKCVFRPNRVLGEAVLAGEGQRAVDVGADAGEALEIAVDDRFAFLLRHAEPPGDAPRRAAVEDREVDRLGLVARVAVDRPEQLLARSGVDVVARAERFLELRHVGHVRGEPQLDLAIVGADSRTCPGSATKASRILRPISVRIGMFCRLGSFDDSRPVCAPVSEKLVWTRPVSGLICACSASV